MIGGPMAKQIRETHKKKGKGYKWHLTDERREKIISLLKQQHTIKSIAQLYGVKDETISKALKKAGIDWRAVKESGIATLRSTVFASVFQIDDPAEKVRAGMSFLKRYDNEQVDTVERETVSADEIARKIMEELSGD